MKIHDCEQNTLDWMNLHVGVPTASGLDNLVTPEFELRKGETPRTYVCKKVAEAIRGRPLIELNSFSVEQGMIVEEEARPFFELDQDKKIRQVGFITTDDGRFGCSPDGLICGEECGIEIKCPAAHTHVKYLVDGVLPKEYAAQVFGSMFVTGYPRWIFMSYRRGFPALILDIYREDGVMLKIGQAVDSFHLNFDRAKARIRQIEEAAKQ